MAWVYLFITALLLIWMCQKYWRTRGPSLAHLPSPKGWPLIGNLLQIDSNNPHFTMTQWSKELGEIYTVKFLSNSMVVLNSFDAIFEALVTKGDVFAGRPQKKHIRLQMVSSNFNDMVMRKPDAKWKVMRKTTQRQIKMYDKGMKRIEDINIEMITDMVQEVRNYQGKPFNPRSLIYHNIMNMMTTFLVNKKYKLSDEEFQLFSLTERMSISTRASGGIGMELDLFPWLRYLGNTTYKKLMLFLETSQKLWLILKAEALEVIKEKEDEENPVGVVHAFLTLLKNQAANNVDESSSLQDIHVKLVTINLLVAGTTTTTSSFYAYLNTISQHPLIQQKLQDEVDTVVGGARPVSLQDRNQMPYTRATVLELLRLASLASLGLPRATLSDTTICGKHIPAGVEVLANLWALHHDETFWDKPFEFQPERFLDEDGQLVSASHNNRRHLMPFGAGQRVCVGEILALSRLFLMIATFAQVFNVKQGPTKVSCDPRMYGPGLVLYPNDYEIQVESRNETLFMT